ncbi:hypothetical protein LZ32DRAFT_612162 [Colletotrichum eremochloae]|nr:hypothetical protein LZ32DRAFT_612162 [Colletotrichum eremochloae]
MACRTHVRKGGRFVLALPCLALPCRLYFWDGRHAGTYWMPVVSFRAVPYLPDE